MSIGPKHLSGTSPPSLSARLFAFVVPRPVAVVPSTSMTVTNGGTADVAAFLNNGDGTFRHVGTF
jgi:hypothetical protein